MPHTLYATARVQLLAAIQCPVSAAAAAAADLHTVDVIAVLATATEAATHATKLPDDVLHLLRNNAALCGCTLRTRRTAVSLQDAGQHTRNGGGGGISTHWWWWNQHTLMAGTHAQPWC
jgi:hypothetical protein